MAKPFLKRILLTNDDGVQAIGLNHLSAIAQQLAEEVWIVAPRTNQSGRASSITAFNGIRIDRLTDQCFAIHGTPADCVIGALRYLMRDNPPQLVLSGINLGANLGNETLLSGTLGAAIIARFMGVPAMALSQAFTDIAHIHWQTVLENAPKIIKKLYQTDCPANITYNINFPNVAAHEVKPLKITRQGRGKLSALDVEVRQDPLGNDFMWLKLERNNGQDEELSESQWLQQGHITITPLHFERTSESFRTQLAQEFNQV